MSKLPEGIRRLPRPGDKPGKPTGKYQARYPVTVNGVTRQVSAGTFRLLDDAKDARSTQIAKLRSGGWVDPHGPRTTVLAWSTEWLALRGRNDRRTLSCVNGRIVPYWGAMRLGDITVPDVQRWVNSMTAEKLTPGTVRSYYRLFKQMMDRAVDYDLLVKTPCRLVTLPAAPPKERAPLTAKDVLALETAAPVRWAAMIHLAAWAGLRWQECAALRWVDVDLERGVLHVRQAVKTDAGGIGETKNRRSRLVTVGPTTVERLRAHRRDFGTRELVFAGQRFGQPINYSWFRRDVWEPTVTASKVTPRPTFHALRHNAVGHMIAEGVDAKVISDQVGHHAASFTMQHYGWSRPDASDVIVSAVEKAISGGAE